MPFHLPAWMDLLGQLGVRMEPQEFLLNTSGKMNREILREVCGIQRSDMAVLPPRDPAESGQPGAKEEERGGFRDRCGGVRFDEHADSVQTTLPTSVYVLKTACRAGRSAEEIQWVCNFLVHPGHDSRESVLDARGGENQGVPPAGQSYR